MSTTTLEPQTATQVEPFTIAGRTFRSRLILGTGKYRDFETMAAALEASGTEMVTVALRRVNLDERGRGATCSSPTPPAATPPTRPSAPPASPARPEAGTG
jgi:hypothetical protein